MATKRVLVPLDGSELSRACIEDIGVLFDPNDYAVTLLRVAEPVEGVVGSPPRGLPYATTIMPEFRSEDDIERSRHPIYADQVESSTRAALESEMRPSRTRLRELGFACDMVVRFGDPATEIGDCAAELPAEVIAMATHGRTGLPRLVMGSVAEAVLRSSATPVLLVRPFAR